MILLIIKLKTHEIFDVQGIIKGQRHNKRSHPIEGQSFFFFQSSRVAPTYQRVSPKIRWKHGT
jgi:hypothetical protein